MAESFVEHALVHYRWALVVFFLLPLSFLYDLYAYVRNGLVFWRRSAPAEHAPRAREVQRQVRAWVEGGKKARMCSARPGWQTMCFRRPLYKNTMRNIRVDLVDVLRVDPRKMVRYGVLIFIFTHSIQQARLLFSVYVFILFYSYK